MKQKSRTPKVNRSETAVETAGRQLDSAFPCALEASMGLSAVDSLVAVCLDIDGRRSWRMGQIMHYDSCWRSFFFVLFSASEADAVQESVSKCLRELARWKSQEEPYVPSVSINPLERGWVIGSKICGLSTIGKLVDVQLVSKPYGSLAVEVDEALAMSGRGCCASGEEECRVCGFSVQGNDERLDCSQCGRGFHQFCLLPHEYDRIGECAADLDLPTNSSGSDPSSQGSDPLSMGSRPDRPAPRKIRCPLCRVCKYCRRGPRSACSSAQAQNGSSGSVSRTGHIVSATVDDVGSSALVSDLDWLVCHGCGMTCHAECTNPVSPRLHPCVRWKCDACRKCSSCEAVTKWDSANNCPEGIMNAWSLPDMDQCKACSLGIDRGEYCPVCMRSWTVSWNGEMVQCDLCQFWVHATCDPAVLKSPPGTPTEAAHVELLEPAEGAEGAEGSQLTHKSDSPTAGVSPKANGDSASPKDGNSRSPRGARERSQRAKVKHDEPESRKALSDAVCRASVKYNCPMCRDMSDTSRMKRVIEILKALDKQRLFTYPVPLSMQAAYSKIVKTPMDLSRMKVKAEAGAYADLREFVGDVRQIILNAKAFNMPNSFSYKLAESFQKSAKLIIGKYLVHAAKKGASALEDHSSLSKAQIRSKVEEATEDQDMEEANGRMPEKTDGLPEERSDSCEDTSYLAGQGTVMSEEAGTDFGSMSIDQDDESAEGRRVSTGAKGRMTVNTDCFDDLGPSSSGAAADMNSQSLLATPRTACASLASFAPGKGTGQASHHQTDVVPAASATGIPSTVAGGRYGLRNPGSRKRRFDLIVDGVLPGDGDTEAGQSLDSQDTKRRRSGRDRTSKKAKEDLSQQSVADSSNHASPQDDLLCELDFGLADSSGQKISPFKRRLSDPGSASTSAATSTATATATALVGNVKGQAAASASSKPGKKSANQKSNSKLFQSWNQISGGLEMSGFQYDRNSSPTEILHALLGASSITISVAIEKPGFSESAIDGSWLDLTGLASKKMLMDGISSLIGQAGVGADPNPSAMDLQKSLPASLLAFVHETRFALFDSCRKCGGFGHSTAFVACKTCGDTFHYYCVGLSSAICGGLAPMSGSATRALNSFTCSDCSVCFVCKSRDPCMRGGEGCIQSPLGLVDAMDLDSKQDLRCIPAEAHNSHSNLSFCSQCGVSWHDRCMTEPWSTSSGSSGSVSTSCSGSLLFASTQFGLAGAESSLLCPSCAVESAVRFVKKYRCRECHGSVNPLLTASYFKMSLDVGSGTFSDDVSALTGMDSRDLASVNCVMCGHVWHCRCLREFSDLVSADVRGLYLCEGCRHQFGRVAREPSLCAADVSTSAAQEKTDSDSVPSGLDSVPPSLDSVVSFPSGKYLKGSFEHYQRSAVDSAVASVMRIAGCFSETQIQSLIHACEGLRMLIQAPHLSGSQAEFISLHDVTEAFGKRNGAARIPEEAKSFASWIVRNRDALMSGIMPQEVVQVGSKPKTDDIGESAEQGSADQSNSLDADGIALSKRRGAGARGRSATGAAKRTYSRKPKDPNDSKNGAKESVGAPKVASASDSSMTQSGPAQVSSHGARAAMQASLMTKRLKKQAALDLLATSWSFDIFAKLQEDGHRTSRSKDEISNGTSSLLNQSVMKGMPEIDEALVPSTPRRVKMNGETGIPAKSEDLDQEMDEDQSEGQGQDEDDSMEVTTRDERSEASLVKSPDGTGWEVSALTVTFKSWRAALMTNFDTALVSTLAFLCNGVNAECLVGSQLIQSLWPSAKPNGDQTDADRASDGGATTTQHTSVLQSAAPWDERVCGLCSRRGDSWVLGSLLPSSTLPGTFLHAACALWTDNCQFGDFSLRLTSCGIHAGVEESYPVVKSDQSANKVLEPRTNASSGHYSHRPSTSLDQVITAQCSICLKGGASIFCDSCKSVWVHLPCVYLAAATKGFGTKLHLRNFKFTCGFCVSENAERGITQNVTATGSSLIVAQNTSVIQAIENLVLASSNVPCSLTCGSSRDGCSSRDGSSWVSRESLASFSPTTLLRRGNLILLDAGTGEFSDCGGYLVPLGYAAIRISWYGPMRFGCRKRLAYLLRVQPDGMLTVSIVGGAPSMYVCTSESLEELWVDFLVFTGSKSVFNLGDEQARHELKSQAFAFFGLGASFVKAAVRNSARQALKAKALAISSKWVGDNRLRSLVCDSTGITSDSLVIVNSWRSRCDTDFASNSLKAEVKGSSRASPVVSRSGSVLDLKPVDHIVEPVDASLVSLELCSTTAFPDCEKIGFSSSGTRGSQNGADLIAGPSSASSSASSSAALSDSKLSSKFRLRRSIKDSVLLAVRKSAIHNCGLFAAVAQYEDGVAFRKNDIVVEYQGEILRQTVADERECRGNRPVTDAVTKSFIPGSSASAGSCYMFRLDADYIVDATYKGNCARFINHSCQPNCFCKLIVTADDDENKSAPTTKFIAIVAKRDIYVNEEVTYDYQFAVESEKLACHCGAPNCMGRLN